MIERPAFTLGVEEEFMLLDATTFELCSRFDEVVGLWREGQRRLAQADPIDKPALEVPRADRKAAHWVEPKLVAEIAYAEFTTDGSPP